MASPAPMPSPAPPPSPSAAPRSTRLPLGRTSRRLSFERRVHLWLTALATPGLLFAGLYTWSASGSPLTTILAVVGVAFAWLIAVTYFTDQFIRPLHTLTNVVAALREDDFSFRARGARRGDALGDLALEINALAATLQQQRSSALDAITLVERVLTSMQSPVLAFDAEGNLRLLNAAARATFSLSERAVGMPAADLHLDSLLDIPDQGLYELSQAGAQSRWSVRRAVFRLQGVPHTLFVLSDVAAALRHEERNAWQRLIRVLSHEINNSLTPIQSIAGSLRSRLDAPTPTHPQDLLRGLRIIEDRAMSLNRFLQAYQQLSRLPPPTLRPVSLPQLLAGVVQLETRVPPTLLPGPVVTLSCDPDQIQQALINLLQNAGDAALANPAAQPAAIQLTWSVSPTTVTLSVTDNGLGLASTANLFVPFYTTKPHGSGIGLVLAQAIAFAHGGSLTLAQAPGQISGCTAELTLPLQHATLATTSP